MNQALTKKEQLIQKWLNYNKLRATHPKMVRLRLANKECLTKHKNKYNYSQYLK